MRPYIAINASALCKEKKTGVEWYSFQLLRHLELEWRQSDPPVVLFVPNKINFPNKNWRIKILPGKYLWTQYHLLKFLKRYPPRLLFSPSYVAPRFLPMKIPTVNVVHGLEGEYFPEFKSVGQILSDYLLVKPALRRNAPRRVPTIIAVSEHTKNDLNHFYGIPLDKIRTVLSGPGTLDGNLVGTRRGAFLQKDGKKIKFLFLGGGNERKNLELAIRIFFLIKQKVGTQRAVFLQIAGNIKDKKLINLIKNREKDVALLGYISEKEKNEQLKSAHFLLYPSFYEGFGFPVLEAQAHGVVPITLRGNGLDEVGGKGIIELDPINEQKSVLQIVNCIEDQKKYKELQQAGLENVQRYSWQSCAKSVKKILLRITEANQNLTKNKPAVD